MNENNNEVNKDNVTSKSFDNFSVQEKEPVHSHVYTDEPKKGNKIVSFLKKNILALVLLLALIIVFVWLTAKNSSQERQFLQEKSELVSSHEKETTELVSSYNSKIDELKIDNIKFASEVFSWSVRSELLRNNVENLNQLVSIFVKKSNVSLVQIIDVKKKRIILSSDKKYEGEPYSGTVNISDTESVVKNSEAGKSQVITPVMGFNSKIALLVITL